MIRIRPLLVLALVIAAGCQSGPASGPLSAADMAAIRRTSDTWLAAVRSGKWEDAAATYTDDAILRFPDRSYEGRAAILKFFQSMQPWPSSQGLAIDEIQGRGDMAFVSGHGTRSPDAGSPPIVVSHYLDIRLRQPDGSWLFYRDMVSPAPPSGTPAR